MSWLTKGRIPIRLERARARRIVVSAIEKAGFEVVGSYGPRPAPKPKPTPNDPAEVNGLFSRVANRDQIIVKDGHGLSAEDIKLPHGVEIIVTDVGQDAVVTIAGAGRRLSGFWSIRPTGRAVQSVRQTRTATKASKK